MNKKILAAVGAVGLLLVMIVAGGGFIGYTKYLKPRMAFSAAQKEMADLKSAKFDFTQTLNAKMEFVGDLEGASEDVEFKTVMKGTGEVDYDEKKMYMKLTADIDGEKEEVEYYLIEDELYTLTNGEYTQSDEESSNAQDFGDLEASQLWDNISENAKYEYVGETKVGDKEVYEYKVELTEEEYKAFKESFIVQFETAFAASGQELKQEVELKGIEYTIYVSKDDRKPVKESVTIKTFNVVFDDQIKINMDGLSLDMVYTSVNEEVKIELPN